MDPRNQSAMGPARPAAHPSSGGPKRKGEWMGNRYMFVVLSATIALLLLCVIAYLFFNSGTTTTESKYVNTKQYQAVFLNNGQVYFGKISALNTKVVVIKEVFYIESQSNGTTTTTTTNNNYTLRKLGSTELHQPEDQMVINRDQVTFWENIKDSGKVVTAINQYKKDPNAANQVQSPTGSTPATGQTTTPTANQNTNTNNNR